MAKRELLTRTLKTASLEVREIEGKAHIKGIIPYDSLSEDLGGYREIIRKGAFTKTLQEGDARCLWAHDTKDVLGRRSAGTLSFSDEADGLHFDCILPNTTAGHDVYETVARRDAPGVSFGFYAIKDSWTRSQGKEPALRELLEVNLVEVSVGVAFPAYPESDSESSTRALFEKNGIKIEKLASVLAKASGQSEYKCEGEEAEEIRSVIETLQTFLPAKEEDNAVQADKGEPEPSTREKPDNTSTFDSRTRELEILLAENENF